MSREPKSEPVLLGPPKFDISAPPSPRELGERRGLSRSSQYMGGRSRTPQARWAANAWAVLAVICPPLGERRPSVRGFRCGVHTAWPWMRHLVSLSLSSPVSKRWGPPSPSGTRPSEPEW